MEDLSGLIARWRVQGRNQRVDLNGLQDSRLERTRDLNMNKTDAKDEFQAPYPPPPLFYKLYTDENVRPDAKGPFSAPGCLALPSLDPPLPVTGEYEAFGQPVSVRFLSSWALAKLSHQLRLFGSTLVF